MVTKIRHIGLVVRDLEKSLKFYHSVLGLTIYKEQEEKGKYIEKLVGIKNVVIKWVKLNIPEGGLIELLQYVSHPDPKTKSYPKNFPANRMGCSHVALTVKDLNKLYKKLQKNKYHCISKPLLAPNGKVKILYCHDPDGIILELIEDILV